MTVAIVVSVDHGGAAPAGASQQAAFPLDPYPGFGRTPAAAERDDTIAAWEAFRRERYIAGCMQAAGFEYNSEVTFPEGALRDVAGYLGVAPATATGITPAKVNEHVRARLSPQRLNEYYLALYGETAQAIADFEAHADDPNFATGGCVGSADGAVGSVWSTYRQLEDALDELRRQAAIDAGPRYAVCARTKAGVKATDPSMLESRADDPKLSRVKKVRVASAYDSCMEVWSTAYAEAEASRLNGFIAAHSSALEAQRDRYATALQAVTADADFRQFLATSIAADPG